MMCFLLSSLNADLEMPTSSNKVLSEWRHIIEPSSCLGKAQVSRTFNCLLFLVVQHTPFKFKAQREVTATASQLVTIHALLITGKTRGELGAQRCDSSEAE